MTKPCGKSWLVTRTWVRSSSISRSGDQPQAVFGVLDIDDGAVVFAQNLRHRHVAAGGCAAKLLAIGGRGILVLEEAMQERGMRRVDATSSACSQLQFM